MQRASRREPASVNPVGQVDDALLRDPHVGPAGFERLDGDPTLYQVGAARHARAVLLRLGLEIGR